MGMFDELVKTMRWRDAELRRRQGEAGEEERRKRAILEARRRVRSQYDGVVRNVLRELAKVLGCRGFFGTGVRIEVENDRWVLKHGETRRAVVGLCFDEEAHPTHFDVSDFSGRMVSGGSLDHWFQNWWQTVDLSQESLVKTLTEVFGRQY